jgi:hypothetical protein
MRCLFDRSGASTTELRDEMKRSFELQRNKKFASDVCTGHARNRKQEASYFKASEAGGFTHS